MLFSPSNPTCTTPAWLAARSGSAAVPFTLTARRNNDGTKQPQHPDTHSVPNAQAPGRPNAKQVRERPRSKPFQEDHNGSAGLDVVAGHQVAVPGQEITWIFAAWHAATNSSKLDQWSGQAVHMVRRCGGLPGYLPASVGRRGAVCRCGRRCRGQCRPRPPDTPAGRQTRKPLALLPLTLHPQTATVLVQANPGVDRGRHCLLRHGGKLATSQAPHLSRAANSMPVWIDCR